MRPAAVLLGCWLGVVPAGVARAEAPVTAAPAASAAPGVARTGADTRPSASAGAPADAATPLVAPAVEATLALTFMSRRFSYVDDVYSQLREYSIDLVPTPVAELGWYPGAHVAPAWGFAGLVGRYEAPQTAEARRENGRTFATVAYAWSAGLRLRLPAGRHSASLGVDVGRRVFRVDEGEVGARPRLPSVEHRTIEVVAGGRFAVGEFVLAPELGGGAVKDTGALGSAAWFPRARAAAVRGSVRLSRPVGGGLEPGFVLEWRRIVVALNPEVGDAHIAGGAADDYLGVGAALSWRGP